MKTIIFAPINNAQMNNDKRKLQQIPRNELWELIDYVNSELEVPFNNRFKKHFDKELCIEEFQERMMIILMYLW